MIECAVISDRKCGSGIVIWIVTSCRLLVRVMHTYICIVTYCMRSHFENILDISNTFHHASKTASPNG